MNWRIARVQRQEEREQQKRRNERRDVIQAKGRSGDGRKFIGSGEDADIYAALTGFNGEQLAR